MKKKILAVLVSLSFFLAYRPNSAYAIYDPLILPNNKFGIHIVEPSDIESAANLVNDRSEKRGDWGYLTFVIQDNDRSIQKWSDFFDKLRTYHLIPIVRLATHGVDGNVWEKPKESDIGSWVEFLDQLPWPIRNRYVVLLNEVNHAREFGGALAPHEYAQFAVKMADSLHAKNDQFFVLPGGFDVYADGMSGTMEATQYWRLMEREIPGIFGKFDGWTSHAYPKKNFSGSPYDTGRYSIKSYVWEINTLHQLFDINPQLPVFITETGWLQRSTLPHERIAEYYKIAFSDVWTEKNIVAVTPFLLSYNQQPFLGFSWKKVSGDGFHPQYEAVRTLAKVIGDPLMVPVSKFGELLAKEREEKLFKSKSQNHRLSSLLYSKQP